MIRLPLIVLTTIALLLSSLGVSQVIHTCLMEQSTAAIACSMCGVSSSHHDETADDGPSYRGTGCCSSTETTRYLDAATMSAASSTLEAPVLPVAAMLDFDLRDALECRPTATRELDLPPPMLAELGRHTYLHTSVFLI